MSYMTGLMAGASLGQQIHKFLTTETAAVSVAKPNKSSIAAFEIVHASAGRKRVRSSFLLGNNPLAAMLSAVLKKSSLFQQVDINSETGSLLLLYNPVNELQTEALLHHLQERVFAVQIRLPQEPAMAESGQEIYSIFARINQGIRRKTCNLFDLQSLASLLFILRGIRKILRYGQMPSGPQMLWWAFSLLRGWKTA